MEDKIISKKAKDLVYEDFAYLSQSLEDVENIIHNDHYIFHKDKKLFRKIFENCIYDESENAKIKELKDEIPKEKIEIPSSWNDAYLLKMCYSGNFKLSNTIKLMKNHLEWIKNPKFHYLTEESFEYLKKGIIYGYGTDKLLRPVVIINVHKIDLKNTILDHLLSAFCFLLNAIQKNMFHPGKVENWVILIDINNMSLWSVPLKILAQVIDCMSNNYPFSLEKLYLLNPSKSLLMIWKMIEAMMDEITTAKLKFLKKENFFEMNEYIDPSQLEEKFGGELKNLEEYWPPKNIYPQKNRSSEKKEKNEKEFENLSNIFGKNQDFYGTIMLTHESHKNMEIRASDVSSLKNESVYQSIMNESQKNIRISRFSKNDSKYVSFMTETVTENGKTQVNEVFYSMVNKNDGNLVHYNESLSSSLIPKSAIKMSEIQNEKNTEITNESCACKCILI